VRIENGLVRKYFGSFAERDISDKTGCTVNPTFGCLKFYHGDHLDSSTLVTSAAGAVVHRQAYKPYGEDLVTPPPGAFTPKYQFTFKEKEADGSGLYDFEARMYDPATGRFISADPVDDSPNRYAYVRNNPLRYNDPTGHAGQGPLDLGYMDDYGVCHVAPPRLTIRAAGPGDLTAAEQQAALKQQGAELVRSLNDLQEAPMRSVVLSLWRAPSLVIEGAFAVQDAKDHRYGALTWDLVGMGLNVIGGRPRAPGVPEVEPMPGARRLISAENSLPTISPTTFGPKYVVSLQNRRALAYLDNAQIKDPAVRAAANAAAEKAYRDGLAEAASHYRNRDELYHGYK
jgi:RHS repeat-associated protein